MRKLIIAVTLIASSFTGAANALPLRNINPPTSSPVVTVDWACGRGYHLSPRGYCRPNRWAPPPRRHYGWDRPHRRWHDDRPRYWRDYDRRERWERNRGGNWR
ncbi:GCG_CRPN prefix-to-repeats domain-containing protein [Rhizobium terrae]|uniref:GCG_CRPN prefix-to-repeats domain-containing protein n=1 Tax=Rhizobium terrae TaxID=2171756 RepID=UPI000E3D6D14